MRSTAAAVKRIADVVCAARSEHKTLSDELWQNATAACAFASSAKAAILFEKLGVATELWIFSWTESDVTASAELIDLTKAITNFWCSFPESVMTVRVGGLIDCDNEVSENYTWKSWSVSLITVEVRRPAGLPNKNINLIPPRIVGEDLFAALAPISKLPQVQYHALETPGTELSSSNATDKALHLISICNNLAVTREVSDPIKNLTELLNQCDQ